MTGSDVAALLPELVLVGGAVFVTVAGRLSRGDTFTAWAVGLTTALTAASAASLVGVGADAFGGAIRRDSAAVFFSSLITLSTAASLSIHRTSPRSVAALLLSAAGAVLMLASGDLAVLALGTALLSAPIAALDVRSRSAVMILGGAGLVALGAADLVVATGSSSLASVDVVATTLGGAGIALVIAGLVLVGHLAPIDAGGSRDRDIARDTHVTVVTRIAAIGALLRLGAPIALTSGALADWRASLAVIAALTIAVATLVALGQSSVRGVLAYGSIAQVGYAAITLTAGFAAGPAAAFFLASFVLTTLGAVALVASLPENARLSDLRGLARRRPVFTAALAILLLGAAGMPPTLGFLAKLYVLELAVSAQLAWLAILAAIASALSVVAYLRIIFACFGEGTAPIGRHRSEAIGFICAIAVSASGVLPGPLLGAVQNVRF